MRSNAPALLPILRSRHQADILTDLLLHPDREYTISELSSRLSTPQSTVSGEVHRLAEAGILVVRAVGRSRQVQNATRPGAHVSRWQKGEAVIERLANGELQPSPVRGGATFT